MLKKILIGVMILGVLTFAFFGAGTYFLAKGALSEHEPMLRQYMQLNEADQNNYILTHADTIIAQAVANAKPEEQADMELFAKTENDPAVQKALVDFGCSVMAKMIVHSDSIVNELDAATKAKYRSESDEFMNRFEKYGNLLDAAKTAAQPAK